MIAQQAEAFARPSLDQRGDKQAIDGPLRLVLADELVQALSVVAWRQLVETDAAAIEDGADLMKVVQLFLHDLCRCPRQRGMLDVRKEQVHRDARRLLLAVRMIDKQQIQVCFDLLQPALWGRSMEVEHAA